ncbi:MAG: hypothetical protein DK306_001100 [Chloroflexi bacterium]|nr:MAG: hypothetical protein DK306_001100 [Chloroflexota bacterium]
MGFRRGLMLGVIVGLVGAVVSGEPSADASGSGGSRLEEARAAGKAEREATEARLESLFHVAKETGHVPEDPRSGAGTD